MGTFARRLWRCRAPLAVLCALGVYALVLPLGWMYAGSARYRVSPGNVRPTAVGIVFGAGAPQGHPSPMLVGRLELALDLYRRGKVEVLLVTGDNSRSHYNEPLVMRDYLIARGVPSGRIVLDYAGFDTWDSCVRAKKIFGVDRAILITQRFHLPRAITLCRSVGIDAWGVGDDSSPYAPIATVISYLRELPAGLKAAYDLVAKPGPRFLGPREPGIGHALETPR
ncbi:SanA/YdcF family protein [Actinoallomurus bryophytorum]|uniref:SanA/YdcF family protein n=1 Tax=Actinoallomurus bryophytorum TaxID=1490222 RepID=UPI001FE62D5E|nr:ElyC/SanA/YdcF family protein [Actinoallomurus bryophytorum]